MIQSTLSVFAVDAHFSFFPTLYWFFEICDEVIFSLSCSSSIPSLLCSLQHERDRETNLTFLIQLKEYKKLDYRSPETAEKRESVVVEIETEAANHFVTT